jgi:hypothetical protein
MAFGRIKVNTWLFFGAGGPAAVKRRYAQVTCILTFGYPIRTSTYMGLRLPAQLHVSLHVDSAWILRRGKTTTYDVKRIPQGQNTHYLPIQKASRPWHPTT